MEPTKQRPGVSPEEQAQLDEQREAHRKQQPYATELDNRELESAQKQKRAYNPEADGSGRS